MSSNCDSSTATPTAAATGTESTASFRRVDPSRMVGLVRRKALIKDLAAACHTECLVYCQELLKLQSESEKSYADFKIQQNSKKVVMRSPKRRKKSSR